MNPLDRLIADLASPLAAVRQEAFGALCARTSSGDMDFAGKKLLARGDTQSLYWLIEYLLALATPEALEKFGELLAHDSETVRIQARNAVGRVEDRARSELLLALLGSPREDDLRFAARMLGE
ncbi:MAG: HEAT repeat domain-containing protein, partial [Candidatus Omnitrophota bacterium]